MLVKPPFPVSTPWAYRARRPEICTGSSLEEFLGALASGDPVSVAGALRNDLQTGVEAAHPEIGVLCARLHELGAQMTGQAVTVTGRCR